MFSPLTFFLECQGRKVFLAITVCLLVLLSASLVTATQPPAGFPDKKLLTTDAKKFWKQFGKAATAADSNLGIVDKGKTIVRAVDSYQDHYGFNANTGYTGRIRYLGGDERCEIWRDRMRQAFDGAGVGKDRIKYVNSLSTGVSSYNIFDVNRVHTAPALIGDDGKVYVFDVWQQGYDKSSMGVGSIKGVGSSPYNGMTMQDWVTIQKKSSRTEIEVDDNPMAIFIKTLAGDTMKELTTLLKAKKCEKMLSGAELQSRVRKYAALLVKNRWKYAPYFLINYMIRKGELQCQDLEIKTSIIMLLDTSGSMSGKKLASAKKAAISAVQGMPPDTEIGLMNYSGGCSTQFPLLPFTRDQKKLIDGINSLGSGGGTPMSPALHQAEKAILAFGKGSSGRIILLCDGQNDCSENPVKAAESIFRRNIPVQKSPPTNQIAMYMTGLFSATSSDQATAAAPPQPEPLFRRIDFSDPIFDELIEAPDRERKEMQIFTVGLQVSSSEQQALDNVAKAGGGQSASAKDTKDLVKAFRKAIEKKPTPEPKPKPPKDESGWETIIDDM